MTLPELNHIYNELIEEARALSPAALPWLKEFRDRIKQAIEDEYDEWNDDVDEYTDRMLDAADQAARDNDTERRGEGRPR
jgi:cytoplasmic iron level regulating protein YaaA (DUF328/UPF0246 family)